MGSGGVKRSASDPATGQPRSKKPTRSPAGPGTLKNMRYELLAALNSIPASLKSRVISKCSLEFLVAEEFSDSEIESDRPVHSAPSSTWPEYSPCDCYTQCDGCSECDSESDSDSDYDCDLNHCVIRLTFQNVQGKATQYSPAGTRGVTIDCHFTTIGIGEKFSPASIWVKTFTHQGPHRYAVKVLDVPVRKRINNRNPTFGEFLRDVQEKQMIPVAFTIDEGGVQGCRDWTSQLLTHWSKRGLVQLDNPAGGSWGHVFNYTYGDDGRVSPTKVIQASFVAGYDRLRIPAINYGPGDPRYDPKPEVRCTCKK